MGTQSSILAWRIPWTEEPGGLQSMGSQRVGHDRVTPTSNMYPQADHFWGHREVLLCMRAGKATLEKAQQIQYWTHTLCPDILILTEPLSSFVKRTQIHIYACVLTLKG